MKRLLYILLLGFLGQSCEEIPPTIPAPNLDSERKVLMEEFSGAKCKPCASAKADIDNLLSIYGDNLIVVTMHTKDFPGVGDPNPGARFDFRTEEGSQILNTHGLPIGIPSSYINRYKFEGEPDLPLGRTQWAGYVAQALDIAPGLGLNITETYDATTRELNVTVTLVPSTTISEEVRLNVMITESHLLDKQLTDDGVVDDYQHDHILRKVLSSVDGDIISDPLTGGAVIEKTYTFTLPPEDGWWVAENCNVVAFATTNDGENRAVLQADEVHLGE